MTDTSWEAWAAARLELSCEEFEELGLAAAADLLVSRALMASRYGAAQPMVTASSKQAGGHSRTVTRRMLDQLRLPPNKRRAVHRLFTGTSTWAGLFAIYGENRDLTPAERLYVRRQLLIIRRATAPAPDASSEPPRRTAEPHQRRRPARPLTQTVPAADRRRNPG